jgi:hypothetical protein
VVGYHGDYPHSGLSPPSFTAMLGVPKKKKKKKQNRFDKITLK